jgi:hypothetical protein
LWLELILFPLQPPWTPYGVSKTWSSCRTALMLLYIEASSWGESAKPGSTNPRKARDDCTEFHLNRSRVIKITEVNLRPGNYITAPVLTKTSAEREYVKNLSYRILPKSVMNWNLEIYHTEFYPNRSWIWKLCVQIHLLLSVKYEEHQGTFMKLTLDWQIFVKNSFTEFHKNPTNILVADTRSRADTDRQTWSSRKPRPLRYIGDFNLDP